MDFAEQLLESLWSGKGRMGHGDIRLEQWNDVVEDVVFGPMHVQLKSLPSTLNAQEFQTLTEASTELRQHFLDVLVGEATLSSMSGETRNMEEMVQYVLASHNLAQRGSQISSVLRAVRDWLRFSLQLQPIVESSRLEFPKIILGFQENGMLQLFLHLMELFRADRSDVARHAGQCLFYATFHPIPSADTHIQSTFAYLLNQLDLPRRILRLYLETDSVGLALSLTQNIHNLLASSPEALEAFRDVRIASVTESSTLVGCPWMVAEHDEIGFRSVWDRILEYCICESEPEFPGNETDYRAELVEEILRSLFALRIGAKLTPSELRLMPRIFGLDDTTDLRVVECQRSAMTLLTEADAATAALLVETSMDSLLHLLNVQIDAVVTASRVDDAAAASLTPVLLTFYRFCQFNNTFLENTRQAVFPSDNATSTAGSSTATSSHRNMAPEDAPEGTLRWKLIRLLTWPQSHVKRFAAEILWLLCGSNPQEFSRRVGMGNALPFLATKGHAQLPSNIFQ